MILLSKQLPKNKNLGIETSRGVSKKLIGTISPAPENKMSKVYDCNCKEGE